MPDRPTRTTIDALRQTLARVEEQAGLEPDDVCLLELKRILLNRIVDLEAAGLSANTRKDRPGIIAGLNVRTPSADQPAVAVAVDLAITLLTDYLSGRPGESVELVASTPDGSRSHPGNGNHTNKPSLD
ncbi:MAG TPA: hypothetical protein VGI45_26070 [Terracidiphilus sp.]